MTTNKLYNKHLGKPVVLVGCGHSMTDGIAKSLMKNKILTIGVNECYRFNDNKFYPTYHIHSDCNTDFMLMNQDMFIKMEDNGTKIVLPNRVQPHLIQLLKSPALFNLNEGYDFLTPGKGENVWFSKGYTAIFTAMQLAVYLGCNPICLIGVDMATKNRKLHPYDSGKMRKEQTARWDETAFPCKIGHITETAAPALVNLGKTVLNLSKESRLECFLKPDTNIEEAMRWLFRVRYSSIQPQPTERKTAIRA